MVYTGLTFYVAKFYLLLWVSNFERGSRPSIVFSVDIAITRTKPIAFSANGIHFLLLRWFVSYTLKVALIHRDYLPRLNYIV